MLPNLQRKYSISLTIHIGITNGTDGFDVIHAKFLWDLPKIAALNLSEGEIKHKLSYLSHYT